MRRLVFVFAGACTTGAILPPIEPPSLNSRGAVHASRSAVLHAWMSGLRGECEDVRDYMEYALNFERDAESMQLLHHRIMLECQGRLDSLPVQEQEKPDEE